MIGADSEEWKAFEGNADGKWAMQISAAEKWLAVE